MRLLTYEALFGYEYTTVRTDRIFSAMQIQKSYQIAIQNKVVHTSGCTACSIEAIKFLPSYKH